MYYLLSLVLPPVAVWLSGHKKQAILSLVLFVLALVLMSVATSGMAPGAYAAGPVFYIASIIHAFIFVHRFHQTESGQIHPHRDTASQSKKPDNSTSPER
ncbi:MAG: YqaE/Pmp3 family membrane protein [Idiomarina sp.]|nr:YqaE/Pmp3 family membrane protein [Idiomarina sp.]